MINRQNHSPNKSIIPHTSSSRILITISLAVISLCLFLVCDDNSISGDPNPAEPTPFDNSVFSGYYTHTTSDLIYRLTGKIGSYGRITELHIQEEGLLDVNGRVDTSGQLRIDGYGFGQSHDCRFVFTGALSFPEDSTVYAGEGEWNGSIETASSNRSISGEWNLQLDTEYPSNVDLEDLDYLCWTGTTSDTLLEFKLLRMDGETGEVSVIGGSGYYIQLIYGPDGVLYGVSYELVSIDPNTGETEDICRFNLDTADYILMAGAEFSSDGKKLYLLENGGDRRFFTADIETGELTLLNTPDPYTRDIAISRAGTMYGGVSDLIIIDPNSGDTYNLIGTGNSHYQAMFFTATGTLLKTGNYPFSGLYTIDLKTGRDSLLLEMGNDDISGIVDERKTVMPKRRVQTSSQSELKRPEESKEFLRKVEQAYKNGQSHIDF